MIDTGDVVTMAPHLGPLVSFFFGYLDLDLFTNKTTLSHDDRDDDDHQVLAPTAPTPHRVATITTTTINHNNPLPPR
jgi:hypothetical protein